MTQHFSAADLQEMEKNKRVNFVNSLSGFKSLNLIGTRDSSGKTNLAIFNSVVHVGAHPPLLGFVNRPDAVERHTLNNIRRMRYYTINHVSADLYKAAHQTAARYPSDCSEFDAVGFEALYREEFFAPFVAESQVQIALKLKEIIPVKTNQTYFVVGQILNVYIPENTMLDDGTLALEKTRSICGSGLNGYHETSLVERLPYAKP